MRDSAPVKRSMILQPKVLVIVLSLSPALSVGLPVAERLGWAPAHERESPMEKQSSEKPFALSYSKCGKQPNFITSFLVPRTGHTMRVFTSECGKQNWIESE